MKINVISPWQVEVGVFLTVKHKHVLKLLSLSHTNTHTQANTCMCIQKQNA